MLKSKGVLLPIQKEILIYLSKLSDMSYFYLTGGTALSEFFFAHRRSYDLDFFTGEKDILIPFSRILEPYLKAKYILIPVRKFESFIEYEVKSESESIVLHFAYDSPFRFRKPEPSEYGINVNDYDDLIVDKLLTFFSRWKPRDAVDLFFILKNEQIDKLLKMAKEKDPGFDLYWFSISLQEVKNYPDDIEKWQVDLLVKINVSELKTLFLNLSRELINRIRKREF